jgi:hypothetical protein
MTAAGKTIGQCLRDIERARAHDDLLAHIQTMVRAQAQEASRQAYISRHEADESKGKEGVQ